MQQLSGLIPAEAGSHEPAAAPPAYSCEFSDHGDVAKAPTGAFCPPSPGTHLAASDRHYGPLDSSERSAWMSQEIARDGAALPPEVDQRHWRQLDAEARYIKSVGSQGGAVSMRGSAIDSRHVTLTPYTNFARQGQGNRVSFAAGTSGGYTSERAGTSGDVAFMRNLGDSQGKSLVVGRGSTQVQIGNGPFYVGGTGSFTVEEREKPNMAVGPTLTIVFAERNAITASIVGDQRGRFEQRLDYTRFPTGVHNEAELVAAKRRALVNIFGAITPSGQLSTDSVKGDQVFWGGISFKFELK